MVDKKKRRHLPARGAPEKPAAQPEPVEEREEFGENTFAGALEAVRGVLEAAHQQKADKVQKPKKKA